MHMHSEFFTCTETKTESINQSEAVYVSAVTCLLPLQNKVVK